MNSRQHFLAPGSPIIEMVLKPVTTDVPQASKLLQRREGDQKDVLTAGWGVQRTSVTTRSLIAYLSHLCLYCALNVGEICNNLITMEGKRMR